MWRPRFVQSALLTAICLAAVCVPAQDSDEPNPIKWTVKSTAATSGTNALTIELRATIDRGWHLYSTEKVEGGPSPTRITIAPGQSFELAGEIDSPAPRSAYDPNFQVATEFYEGDVAFTLPVKSTIAKPPDKLRIQVRYQTCTPTICLPPKLIDLETSLQGGGSNSPSSSPSSHTPLAKAGANGSTVADFSFVDFAGQQRRFSEFRGRVMLLDFWASWCSPCLADIPQLKAAYEKYHAQGFDIIGMDSETLGQKDVDAEFAQDAQAKAREIVNTRGVSWTQATAETSLPVAAGSFGIESLPAKILIDRNGQIVTRIKSVADLEQLLPALLKP